MRNKQQRQTTVRLTLFTILAFAGRRWRQRRAQQRSLAAFRGKTAVVTGGASGIGRGLALALGRRGATVIVADINESGAAETAAVIHAYGGGADGVKLDVRDTAAFTTLITQTAAQYGRLDYLFNNAGIAVAGETTDISDAQWRQILEINLHSVIDGSRAAYRVMRRQGSGHIVNIASMAGLLPLPDATPYSATKFGVVGFSQALRLEAAPHGVRVSVICPSFVDTPIYDNTIYVNRTKADALQALSRLKLIPIDACVTATLRGVAQNQGIVTITGQIAPIWWLYRLNPNWGNWALNRLRK